MKGKGSGIKNGHVLFKVMLEHLTDGTGENHEKPLKLSDLGI
jgi:hypothetical protein